jgi:SAM-dependent methyltransferase
LEELALAGPLPACLDVGTGTGLLCLAAAALGSPRLGAVDIDSLALRAASEAFDRAGLRVELSAELPDQPWPLVLANLHRAAILAVIDPLSRAVAPGGHLLLSGFVQGAEEELSRQLGMKGLVVRRRWRDQGWVALLLGRPAAEGPTMEISLERLSPEEHRLALRRASGPEERVTLNTRSFLLHDLVHYSVEAEADLREAFWGSLAAGRSLEELGVQARQAWPEGSELAWAEGVVGPLQGALRRGQPAEELYRELERRAEDAGEVLPPFLDRPMLERAAQRCQQLLDRWSRLGIGGFIRLPWPVPRS